LYEFEADNLAEGLNILFDRTVDVARIKHINSLMIAMLISEEALLFAKYLRNERKEWNPRVPSLSAELEGKKSKELIIST